MYLYIDFLQFEYLIYSFLSAITTFLLYFYLYKSIAILEVSKFSMLSMMYSVFVAIFSYYIFNDVMNHIQIIGGLIIIFSVVLIEKKKI
jgi:drug/metabolite transporter (DMT)-like permease